jgi:hypothetical protein
MNQYKFSTLWSGLQTLDQGENGRQCLLCGNNKEIGRRSVYIITVLITNVSSA